MKSVSFTPNSGKKLLMVIESPSFLEITESESSSGFVLLGRSKFERSRGKPLRTSRLVDSAYPRTWSDPLVELRAVEPSIYNPGDIRSLRNEIAQKDSLIEDLRRKIHDLRV